MCARAHTLCTNTGTVLRAAAGRGSTSWALLRPRALGNGCERKGGAHLESRSQRREL